MFPFTHAAQYAAEPLLRTMALSLVIHLTPIGCADEGGATIGLRE